MLPGVVVFNVGVDGRRLGDVNDDGSSGSHNNEGNVGVSNLLVDVGNEVICKSGQLSIRAHVSVGSPSLEPGIGCLEDIPFLVEQRLGDDFGVSTGIIAEVIASHKAYCT